MLRGRFFAVVGERLLALMPREERGGVERNRPNGIEAGVRRMARTAQPLRAPGDGARIHGKPRGSRPSVLALSPAGESGALWPRTPRCVLAATQTVRN